MIIAWLPCLWFGANAVVEGRFMTVGGVSGAASKFEVLWEDADLIAVSKPVGLLVDSGKGSAELVKDLVTLVRDSSTARSEAFAFHRLDRETSGVVLLGKTRRFAKDITKLFEDKKIRKAYLAIVSGEWPSTLGRVDRPIEGRAASTTFRRFISGTFEGSAATLIEALPKTGRTHQIRIHCSVEGFPVLGDARYGPANGLLLGPQGHALHAYRLDFRHPASGETISVRAEPRAWRTTWLAEFSFEPIWKKIFQEAAE
jgi:RluA family pseudouridine synthase